MISTGSNSLETAIEQAGDSILITDARGNIQYANPAFLKLSGYTSEELIGQPTRIFKSGRHDEAFYQELWKTVSGGEVWEDRIENRRKDGSIFVAEANIAPVRDPDGKITHYIEILHDLTDFLQMEALVRQNEKMDALGTLAGGIAHDFNNVLTAILALSGLTRDLIESGAPNSSILEKVSLIEDSSKRAKRLVQQILSFSRDQGQSRKEVVSLQDVANYTLSMLRASLSSSSTIWADFGETPQWVKVDPSEIQQIFLNLITNSSQALPEEGGIIRVSISPVDTDSGREHFPTHLPEGTYHCISIEDNGCGMSPSTVQKIFDPFYTTKPKGIGTGLGLNTIKRIVDNLKGGITVESDPGKGTTFRVFLPPSAPPQNRTDPEESAPPPTWEGLDSKTQRKPNLLFIEDETMLLKVGKETFEVFGLEVHAFRNSSEALEAYLANPYQYDAVLTDLNMPGRSGLGVAREIRKKRKNLPIFVLTASDQGIPLRRNPPPEITEVFLKPVSYKNIAEQIRTLLQTQERSQNMAM